MRYCKHSMPFLSNFLHYLSQIVDRITTSRAAFEVIVLGGFNVHAKIDLNLLTRIQKKDQQKYFAATNNLSKKVYVPYYFSVHWASIPIDFSVEINSMISAPMNMKPPDPKLFPSNMAALPIGLAYTYFFLLFSGIPYASLSQTH